MNLRESELEDTTLKGLTEPSVLVDGDILGREEHVSLFYILQLQSETGIISISTPSRGGSALA